jgi:uncharacterized protein (DUF1499 family)
MRPADLGGAEGALAPCPASPNCVSSAASDAPHAVEAFALTAPPDAAWRAVREALAELPRTTVVAESADRLRAESRSALFGFVDDLELQLHASQQRVEVRSASRVGYSDLGVNRRRVERLRAMLRARGVVR